MSAKEHSSAGSIVQLPLLGFNDTMVAFPVDASVPTTLSAAAGERLVTVTV
jgi:hypothetical protein